MTADVICISEADATALCHAALVASNTSDENAAYVAEALVQAEADGHGGHGLSRIPSYTAQSRVGKVDGFAVPSLEVLRPAAIAVDAGHGFAFPAIALAIPDLAQRCRSQGIAAAVIRRSHHFGVAGHACEKLAAQGMIAFMFGNAPKSMAPWGAREPVLGTNPIAFAAPMADGPPLVIDLATTSVVRGKILAARDLGEAIPEGWALDPDGNPTTDANLALQGTVAPMGGAKGAALGLMVEVMAACLTGSTLGADATSLFDDQGLPPDLGQTMLAIDAKALSGGMYTSRIAALAGIYHDLDGARLPGQRRLLAREKAAKEGLTIRSALLEQIKRIAGA